MANWYMKGQSDYLVGGFHMGFYIDYSGFAEGDYDTQDMETHGATSDPFMAFGVDTGPATWTYGQQQVEIGLLKSHRLKFDTTGSYKWVGPGQDDWAIIEAGGGSGNLGDLDDVVITGTPAEDEVLAWDTTSSKWINQTGGEAGLATTGDLHSETHALATTGPHTGTLPWTDLDKTGSNLTDLATRQHAGLTDITTDQHHPQSHALNSHTQGSNVIFMAKGTAFTEIGIGTAGYVLVSGGDGEDLIWESHYTQAEVNGLLHPQSHTLASHSSEAHNELTGYNDETDVKHLTDAQLGDLHTIYTLEAHALATTGPHTGSLPLTDLDSWVAGNIIIGGAADWEALVKGTATYVLKMGATYPAWGQVGWTEVTGKPTEFTPISHDNAYHSTNYHTESDGTGVVTVHSDVTSAGSGAIITTLERDALHPQLTNLTELGTRNHNDLLNINDGDSYEHITQTQKNLLHTIYSLEVHDNDEHDPDYASEAILFEKGTTFPGAPTEGLLHWDTVDEAWYRYSSDAQAWIQIGGAGVGSNTALTLEQARGNDNGLSGTIDMNQNLITDLPAPTTDDDVARRNTATHGIASDDLVISNDTERTTQSTSYFTLKEITMYKTTAIRVYYEAKATGTVPVLCYARLFVNDVAVGTQNGPLSTSYTAYTDDVVVNSGDTIQIKGYVNIGRTVYVYNQRIKYVEYAITGGK